ncbi:aldo/keto reductase [Agaribacter marinus]|uniref:Oxidoreductase n=1 Tax=Agaribacter marinus TaxID=1431249 RepID=A0AA37WG74_9ALTE|nr:aldo/keto reductase [Agaribacter marinus]GLR69841.1 oxidoreductase [Agaribacter marinus]
MQYRQLGKTNLKLSTVSYGASPLGSVFRNISEKDGIKTVHKALDLGVNYIDVSPYYGATVAETVLGKALKGISRDKYILSTKAGRYGPDFPDFDFSEKRIRQSLTESCNRLGVDNVDILFLHDIEFGNMQQVKDEALPCLQALKDEGHIRYIGVTGYPLKVFSESIEAFDIDCILTYCRHGLHDISLKNIIPSLDEAGVGIINASPTGMGLLTERGAPEWHPGSKALLDASKRAVALCVSQGVDPTALALQYAMNHPSIASTVVGTANPLNIEKNVKWAENALNVELAEQVRRIFADVDCTWSSGYPENQD